MFLPLLTGGRIFVVRFCGFPPQGSETLTAPTEEKSKNSTLKKKKERKKPRLFFTALSALSADFMSHQPLDFCLLFFLNHNDLLNCCKL